MQAFYNSVIPSIWVAWFIYWRVMSGHEKKTVRRETVAQRVFYIGLLVLGASMFTINFSRNPDFFLYRPIYPRSHLTFWLGVAIMLAGFAFTSWARVTLGRNWSSTVTMKENHELIQTGPYALVRHPIYTGLMLMFIGTAGAIAEWRGVVAIVLTLISFLYKLKIEEAWMSELFGEKYAAYKKRVAMLVPWIW